MIGACIFVSINEEDMYKRQTSTKEVHIEEPSQQ